MGALNVAGVGAEFKWDVGWLPVLCRLANSAPNPSLLSAAGIRHFYKLACGPGGLTQLTGGREEGGGCQSSGKG